MIKKLPLKRLPVDVSDFKKMIKNDYLYVDKTQVIYNLITQRRLFFLSRPRRFGKSLLISTLNELFSGNKELFKDLWIEQHSDYSWPEHPVIQLDFSMLEKATSQEFKISLAFELDIIAESYDIDLSRAKTPGMKLKLLVSQLAQKKDVVILIDEYDSPLLAHITNQHIAKNMQQVMHDFFMVIKGLDKYLHAIFITGVTKLSKTSIFSGMNNLNDLSMDPRAAALLGYTKEELHNYFDGYMHEFSQHEKISVQDGTNQITSWYNGYRFSEDPIKVYNPYSIIHCFDNNKIANYWLETGTPTFLIELLKKQYEPLKDIENLELSGSALGTFEVNQLPIVPILFQTGYLTIESYDKNTRRYKLCYPNRETEESFKSYIIVSLTQNSVDQVDNALGQFKRAIDSNNIELFCTALKSLFANIPYEIHVHNEAYYHSILHVLLDLLGYKADSEISVSNGRLDLVIISEKQVLICEFKFKSTGQKALDQILDRRYYEKYLRFNKPITLLGLSFNYKNKELILDSAQRNV